MPRTEMPPSCQEAHLPGRDATAAAGLLKHLHTLKTGWRHFSNNIGLTVDDGCLPLLLQATACFRFTRSDVLCPLESEILAVVYPKRAFSFCNLTGEYCME